MCHVKKRFKRKTKKKICNGGLRIFACMLTTINNTNTKYYKNEKKNNNGIRTFLLIGINWTILENRKNEQIIFLLIVFVYRIHICSMNIMLYTVTGRCFASVFVVFTTKPLLLNINIYIYLWCELKTHEYIDSHYIHANHWLSALNWKWTTTIKNNKRNSKKTKWKKSNNRRRKNRQSTTNEKPKIHWYCVWLWLFNNI